MSDVASSSSSGHDLFDFMREETDLIAAEYLRVRRRSIEDPGTAGDQGEENWKSVLENWLPAYFKIVTKGRIIGTDGRTSGQIDVIVLSSAYPKALWNKKLYLAGGVIAAFECKTTLRKIDIDRAIKMAVTIRDLTEPTTGSPYHELHSPILFGLLAHSSDMGKGKKTEPIERIDRAIWEADHKYVLHPRQTIDLICVADLASWASFRTTFIGPSLIPNYSEFSSIYGAEGSAMTNYMRYSLSERQQVKGFTPVGSFLTVLFNKLAHENASMRSIARYLTVSELGGHASGGGRLWPSSIYSEAIRDRILQGKLSDGASWDDWHVAFV